MTATQLISKLAEALYDESDAAGNTYDSEVCIIVGNKGYEIKNVEVKDDIYLILGRCLFDDYGE